MDLAHLDRPLLPAERQRMWAFLAARAVPRGGMDAETLDGFFTALVLSPEPVMPAVFLEPVFGPREAGLFATEAEAELWVGMAMRRWNELAQRLLGGAPSSPWLLPDKATQGRAWARGFLRGMAVQPAAWDPLRRAQPELLLPLLRLAEREDAPQGPLDPRTRRTVVAGLPLVIAGLRGFWRR